MTDPAAQSEIDLAADRFSTLLHRHLPDLLLSLNLVGSAVNGDFRPGRSDLDFVAVSRHAPADDELEGLSIVHRLYASDPTLPTIDGIWVTSDDLAAGPDNAAAGPATRDGAFLARAEGNRNPVTWFDLHDRSRAVLGTLDRDAIWHDPLRLVEWTRGNVEDYWVRWHAQSSRLLSSRGLAMLGRQAPAWGVLGISRIHATVSSGQILSKSEAGKRALGLFGPQWRGILDDALAIRGSVPGPLLLSPWQRRRWALDFVAMTIQAIRTLPPFVSGGSV